MFYLIEDEGYIWAANPKSIDAVRQMVFKDLQGIYKKLGPKAKSKTYVIYKKANEMEAGKGKKAGELKYNANIGNLFWHPVNSKKKYIVNRHGEIAEF